MSRVALVVQARMGSTRLPGKVLRGVGGVPLLALMLERLSHVRNDVTLVVATTHSVDDDAIVSVARRADVRTFRGHATDLLDRHIEAALTLGADVVVKVPSDCPLIDPELVDDVLDVFLAADGMLAYASNLHPRTHADGNDVEVMAVEALLRAHGETERPIDREHTTPYIVEHPDWFPSRNVRSRDTRDAARFRHVVDYIEDLVAVNAIDEALCTKTRRPYGHREIISLLEARPDIVAMNAMHVGDSWQRRHAMALVHREPVKGMHHARTRDIEDRRLRG